MIEMTPHPACMCFSCAHCYSTLGISPRLEPQYHAPTRLHHDDCVHCAAFRREAAAVLDTVEVDPALWESSFPSGR